MTMGYSYDSMADVTKDNVAELVKKEVILHNGELLFRGKSFSDWYQVAFDAFDSWFDGERWGTIFEKIGEQLEELEFDRTDDIY